MGKNINLLTLRNVVFDPCYQIVYEWEDEICKNLGLKIKNDYTLKKNNIFLSIKSLLSSFINNIFSKNKSELNVYFEMAPRCIEKIYRGLIKINKNTNNNSNAVPIIIDFYLKKEQLNDFYRAYNKVKFLIISSKEAYSFLIENNCPISILHLPLSLPDKYKLDLDKYYEKKYNLVLIGHCNPFLVKCLNKYCDYHPDFIYFYQKTINNSIYYVSNKGEIIGQYQSREKYIDLIRSTKIAFYSTPSIDKLDGYTNGFNQVTPRLFELMAAQCLILARYSDNDDTRYYNLNKYLTNIDNYTEFENCLENFLNATTYPQTEYENFLSENYTSHRSIKLLSYLNNKY